MGIEEKDVQQTLDQNCRRSRRCLEQTSCRRGLPVREGMRQQASTIKVCAYHALWLFIEFTIHMAAAQKLQIDYFDRLNKQI